MSLPGYEEKWIVMPVKVYFKRDANPYGPIGAVDCVSYKTALLYYEKLGYFTTERDALVYIKGLNIAIDALREIASEEWEDSPHICAVWASEALTKIGE